MKMVIEVENGKVTLTVDTDQADVCETDAQGHALIGFGGTMEPQE